MPETQPPTTAERPPLIGPEVSEEVVAELLDDIVETIENRRNLASRWYTDPQVFDVERSAIFTRAWLYAGASALVDMPGMYATTELAGVPVLIVRGEDGVLRAFLNVCRHRGCVLAQGVGTASVLQCRYHAWTYDLTGALKGVPRSNREIGFRHENYGLLECSVAEWGPWIFVNLDPDATAFTEQFGDLIDFVDTHPDAPAVSNLEYVSRQPAEAKANWKLAMENGMECYHCATVHPLINKCYKTGPDDFKLVCHERWALASIWPKETIESGVPGMTDPQHFAYVFPNYALIFGPDYIWIQAMDPLGVDRCTYVTDFFFRKDLSEAARKELIDANDIALWEDIGIVSEVQVGHGAGLRVGGPLFLDSEVLIANFHQSQINNYLKKVNHAQ